MIGALGFRNRLRACACYCTGKVRHVIDACLGFLNNDLPDVMANSMHLVGKAAFIKTFCILRSQRLD